MDNIKLDIPRRASLQAWIEHADAHADAHATVTIAQDFGGPEPEDSPSLVMPLDDARMLRDWLIARLGEGGDDEQ